MNVSLIIRLSVMMFVQYAIWGAWAPTIGNYMGVEQFGSAWIGWAYSFGPIAAMAAPFFLGMVADRFFDSEKVLGVLFSLAGIAMLAMPSFADNPELFMTLLGVHALCYFPTLSLTASLAFHHLSNQEKEFPVVRVFGTIGWVVVGVTIGYFLQADATATPLYIGGGLSVFLGLYSFTLPYTPPPSAGKKTTWREIAGFDALRQLKSLSFIVFLVAGTLIFIAFGVYFPDAPRFFQDLNLQIPEVTAFSNPSFEMSAGQASEIIFMLLIPFFFRRLGVKWMLMMGMLAWVARFTLFASASLTGSFWVIMLGIAIHGICYDFFFVTGQIYIDKKTSPEIRGQVQGLLVLLTQGVGFFIGTRISGAFHASHPFPEGVAEFGEGVALALPDWQLFWGAFAVGTLVFALLFFALFKDEPEAVESPA